jgi:NitT/TauT family transport system permease protein
VSTTTPAPVAPSTAQDAALSPAPTRKRSPRKVKVGAWAGRTAFVVAEFALAVLLWDLLVRFSGVSERVIPGPGAVGESLWSLLQSSFLWSAGWVTIQETLVGFAIGAALGIGLAVIMTEVPFLYRALNPFVVAFQAMPKIAIAPLLLIWFGFGMSSKIVLVVVMVFFPILVNTYTGLNSVRAEQLDLMKACRASRWETFRRVRFYAALPFILASFEVSFVLALTAAVVAEILGSGTTIGLGTLLQLFNARIDMAGMFAVVVVLSALGMVLYASVKALSNYLLRWNQSTSD